MCAMTVLERREWTRRGYHAFPVVEEDRALPDYARWRELSDLVGEARRGEFGGIPGLIERLGAADDWALAGSYARLLADAGGHSTLRRVRDEVFPNADDLVDRLAYGSVLGDWGHLSVVPALIALFREACATPDGAFVRGRIERLLEAEPGPLRGFLIRRRGEREDTVELDSVDQYCALAARLCGELRARLGTEDVVVFRGDVLSVGRVCRVALDDLRRGGRFDEQMRRRFEASTGVDASGFYRDGRLQPLAAAAIVEGFLDSGEADRYEPGARYFFGHRVPD